MRKLRKRKTVTLTAQDSSGRVNPKRRHIESPPSLTPESTYAPYVKNSRADFTSQMDALATIQTLAKSQAPCSLLAYHGDSLESQAYWALCQQRRMDTEEVASMLNRGVSEVDMTLHKSSEIVLPIYDKRKVLKGVHHNVSRWTP